MNTEIRPDINLPLHQPHMRIVYRKYFKRPMDVILSFCAIITLSPLLLLIALLVRLKLGSPVIFRQNRVGLNGEIFTLYKFRTMADKRDVNGELLPDDNRVTPFGVLLRKLSLDELPELFNILTGKMSIVGPRPLIVEYLPYYTPKERHRHDVKPGLTGLAQVSGRSFLRWEEKFALDIEYVNKCSFLLDCVIMLKTLKHVLIHKDVADIEKVQKDNIGIYIAYQGHNYRRLDQERSDMNNV